MTNNLHEKYIADYFAPVGGSTGPRPQRDGGESRADDKFAGCSTDALCAAIGWTRSHTQQIETPCDKAGETTGSTTKGWPARGSSVSWEDKRINNVITTKRIICVCTCWCLCVFQICKIKWFLLLSGNRFCMLKAGCIILWKCSSNVMSIPGLET